MLQKLLSVIESANFKGAVRQGRLACPSCGSGPGQISQPMADDVITCAKCGTSASALEWSTRPSAQKLIGKAGEPPASTRIVRECDDSGAIFWNIPASGKSGGLMFFAIFWCGLLAALTAAFVFGKISKGGDWSRGWGFVLFFVPFWAVGLGVAYVACRSKYARHRLIIDRSTATLRRELFGKSTDKKLSTETIQSIAAVEFYQSNYQPVNGVEIRAPQGKLRFGSMLTEEEKAWLVADLKHAVFGDEPTNQTAAVVLPTAPARRGDFFSVALPMAPKSLLAPGVMLFVIGVAFILVGIFVIDPQVREFTREKGSALSSIFDFMRNSFRVMWIGMSSLFALIGVALLTRYGKTRHHQTRLEGTKDGIVLRTTKAGRIVSQRDFPKGEFVDVRASVVGSSNGKPMKRIELLIGQKAHNLGRWFDGEKAEAFVAEVRRALFPASGTV